MKKMSLLLAGFFLLLMAGFAGAANIFNATVNPTSVYETAVQDFNLTITVDVSSDSICEVNITLPLFTAINSSAPNSDWNTSNGINWVYWNTVTNCIKNGGGDPGIRYFMFRAKSEAVLLDTNDMWLIWTNTSTGYENVTYHNITIMNDSISPLTELLSPADDNITNQENVTFELRCSDNLGVDTLQLWGNWSGWHASQTNPSPVNNSVWTVTLSMPQGTWTWGAWCNDTAGNSNWSAENRTLTVDSVNPTLAIHSPDNSIYNHSTIDLNVSANEAIDTWWYSLNNESDVVFVSPNTTTAQEGSNTLTVWGNDSAGNMNSTTVYFTVDTVPPQFSLHSINPDPPNEDQDIQLNITVSDDVTGVNSVWLEWNNSINYTITSNVSGMYCFTMASGNYTAHDELTYRWWASDGTGHTNKTEEYSFTVANRPPAITLLSPGNGSSVEKGTITLSYSSSDADDEDNVTHYVFFNGGLNTTTSASSVQLVLPDGSYNWSVTAWDGHDNTSSGTFYFTAYTPSSPPPGGSPSGYYSPPPKTCKENWTCSEWSGCANNSHTRVCTDTNNCSTVLNKPSESMPCRSGDTGTEPPERPEPENICAPGEFRCFGSEVQACSEGVKWITIEECDYRCEDSSCLERPHDVPGQAGVTGMILGIGATALMAIVGIIIVLAIGVYWLLFRHRTNFPGY